jgi:hypothetical protein
MDMRLSITQIGSRNNDEDKNSCKQSIPGHIDLSHQIINIATVKNVVITFDKFRVLENIQARKYLEP